MPLQVFDDAHFSKENSGGSHNCTRVIWDTDDGGTSYDNIKIFRFGNKGVAWDWTSPKRQGVQGNFPRASDPTLNGLALSQVRFGRKGAVGPETPFVSVATNYQALYENGEPWVQELLKCVPDLGVFIVPFDTLMRPGINSHATVKETEWLYYDGGAPLLSYLHKWLPNPYKK
ncbi:MAG: hypothetical protein RI907_3478 [Pseudomonadota bacterium]|jgi:hypothetical protein